MLYCRIFLHEWFVQQFSFDSATFFFCNISVRRSLSGSTIQANEQNNAQYTRSCLNILPLHTPAILECSTSAPLEYSYDVNIKRTQSLEYSCDVNIKKIQFQSISMMSESKEMNWTSHDSLDVTSRIMTPLGISINHPRSSRLGSESSTEISRSSPIVFSTAWCHLHISSQFPHLQVL